MAHCSSEEPLSSLLVICLNGLEEILRLDTRVVIGFPKFRSLRGTGICSRSKTESQGPLPETYSKQSIKNVCLGLVEKKVRNYQNHSSEKAKV